VSAFVVQLRSLRDTLFEECENAVRNEVQGAASLVRAIAEEAKLGHITDAEAQECAKAAVRTIRAARRVASFRCGPASRYASCATGSVSPPALPRPSGRGTRSVR
jgi:hypothetical protein